MPRQARLDARPPRLSSPRDGGQAPGILHHVVIRGIERKEMVKDDHDRQNFVYRIGTISLERRILQSWTAIDIVVIQYYWAR
jgi:hypothetical protein